MGVEEEVWILLIEEAQNHLSNQSFSENISPVVLYHLLPGYTVIMVKYVLMSP